MKRRSFLKRVGVALGVAAALPTVAKAASVPAKTYRASSIGLADKIQSITFNAKHFDILIHGERRGNHREGFGAWEEVVTVKLKNTDIETKKLIAWERLECYIDGDQVTIKGAFIDAEKSFEA